MHTCILKESAGYIVFLGGGGVLEYSNKVRAYNWPIEHNQCPSNVLHQIYLPSQFPHSILVYLSRQVSILFHLLLIIVIFVTHSMHIAILEIKFWSHPMQTLILVHRPQQLKKTSPFAPPTYSVFILCLSTFKWHYNIRWNRWWIIWIAISPEPLPLPPPTPHHTIATLFTLNQNTW